VLARADDDRVDHDAELVDEAFLQQRAAAADEDPLAGTARDLTNGRCEVAREQLGAAT